MKPFRKLIKTLNQSHFALSMNRYFISLLIMNSFCQKGGSEKGDKEENTF